MKERIKAWVTKYALTEGIICVDGKVYPESDGNMLLYGEYNQAVHGKDWHRTPDAALARAEEMQKAKIASLKKRIKKMEALKFEVPNDTDNRRCRGRS